MRDLVETGPGWRFGDMVISWVWVWVGIQIRQVSNHRNSVALRTVMIGNKQASFCLLRARRRITLLCSPSRVGAVLGRTLYISDNS